MSKKNPDKIAERVTRLEEKFEASREDRTAIKMGLKEFQGVYDKRVSGCMDTFEEIRDSLNTINTEQGQTRDAVKSLQTAFEKQGETLETLIRERVSAPMSGKDKALLYGTAVTAFFTFLSVVVPAIVNALSGR